MTRKIAFTRTVLDRLTVPAGRDRIWVFDAHTPNLAYMKTAAGSTSYYRVYKQGKKPIRYLLGPGTMAPDAARDLCNKIAVAVANGVDVQQERRNIAKDATLGEIWNRYRDEHLKPNCRPSTITTDLSRWDTCFAADWSTRRVTGITPADVQRKMIELANGHGNVTANRAVQLLRRLLAFAKVQPNPCRKGEVKFYREAPRERFLTGDELAKLMTSIDAEPNILIADFIRMAIWTGQRRSNVASMMWREVDLANATWNIPGSKFKTRKPLSVPLVKPALEVLASRQNNGSEYVFPGRDGTGHLQEPKTCWKHILERAELKNIHIHDLRHNLASFAVQHGASLYAVGKVLGHADQASTARYSHLAMDPLRLTINVAVDAMTAAVAAARAKKAEAK